MGEAICLPGPDALSVNERSLLNRIAIASSTGDCCRFGRRYYTIS